MPAYSTDELFIRAPQRDVARALLDLSEDCSWWRGARTRGSYGWVEVSAPTGRPLSRARFRARIGPVREWENFAWFIEDGEIEGRAEWWLEAFKDGTVVHYYLDVERGTRGRWRRMSAAVRRHRWAIRRGVNDLKDRLEERSRSATSSAPPEGR